MPHFVLILLSRKNISLYYDADANSSYLQHYGDGNSYGSDYWTPFVAVEAGGGLQVGTDFAYGEMLKRSAISYYDLFPLSRQADGSFQCGGERPMADLPFLAVEAYLHQFFSDVYHGEDFVSMKVDLALGLVFSSDIGFEDRSRLVEAFRENGYGNLAMIDFNASLIDAMTEQKRLQLPYTCVLENNGQDILSGLYISQTAERLAIDSLIGMGRDPRVDYGVKLLWESLDTHGLSLDNERPILSDIVKRFMDNDAKSRLCETVVLSNNKEYDAYLLKNEIDAATLVNEQLYARINAFLKKNEVEPAKVNLVYREFSSKNNLLETSVSPYFSPTFKVSDKLLSDVLANLWSSAKRNRMDVSALGKTASSNAEGVRIWVQNADGLNDVLNRSFDVIGRADAMAKPVVDDLKKTESVWLEHLKQSDFKGAKLKLQLNVSSDLTPVLSSLDAAKNELDEKFSIIQAIAGVEDAKPHVERYHKALDAIATLTEAIGGVQQFVSKKMEETDRYESLFPEYKRTLEELRKTSVRSLQDRLIEKIKTLVPPGFEIPMVQTSKMKVSLSAEVSTTGFLFAKKSKLTVRIDLGEYKVPFRCVLAFFTDMVVRVDRDKAFVVDLNGKDEPLCGVVVKEFDLPLPKRELCGKKGELTIKLWPHEAELIGINSAFEGNSCSVQI